MGTRSTIALEFADGTVEQVYCHWDGYLEHNGGILSIHYKDPFKVQQLLALGDFSTLESTVELIATQAYSNRGEVCPARKYRDFDEYVAECQQEEYDYILRRINGAAVWHVRCCVTDDRWVTLDRAEELEALEKDMA